MRHTRRSIAVAAALALLASCGGDDDAAQEAGEQSADRDPAGGRTATPDDCLDIYVDFLKDIEPVVEDIDWETAPLRVLGTIAGELEERTEEFAARSREADCDDYDPGTDEGVYDELLERARREAPGTVGWLEYIDSIEVPPEDGEITGDCSEAIAIVERYVEEYDGVSDIPVGDLDELGNSLTVIGGVCESGEANEFYQRGDVNDFLAN